MIDGKDCVREQLLEDGFEQESERAAVESHAVRARHRDGLDQRFDGDRKGQFAELPVHNRADNRGLHQRAIGFFISGWRSPVERLKKFSNIGAAWTPQDRTVRKMDFDRRGAFDPLEFS